MNKFCGIDLYSNNSVVVVSDEGKRLTTAILDGGVALG